MHKKPLHETGVVFSSLGQQPKAMPATLKPKNASKYYHGHKQRLEEHHD